MQRSLAGQGGRVFGESKLKEGERVVIKRIGFSYTCDLEVRYFRSFVVTRTREEVRCRRFKRKGSVLVAPCISIVRNNSRFAPR